MNTNQNNVNLNNTQASNLQPTSSPLTNSNIQGNTQTTQTPVGQQVSQSAQATTQSVAQPVAQAPVKPQVSQSAPTSTQSVAQPTVQAPVKPQVVQNTPATTQSVAQPAVQAPVQPAPVQPVTLSPQTNSEEIVINTTKKKTSNIIIIVLVVIMILFVFNMDTVLDYINNYINNGTISNNTNQGDNLANGFIMIDDTSYMNLNEIRFYNFKKKADSVEITFNYEVNKKYDDVSTLKMYIELYNSDKELIYKELFNPGFALEKGTIRSYTISLTNDVYTSAFYALVKTYTEQEENSTSKLVCKFNDSNENVSVNYEITYNFKNNGLTSYNVNKNYQSKNETIDNYVTEIENEYNSVKDIITSSIYENNTLQYTVDFTNNLEGFIPLYNKDTIINTIKEKETLKKWNCE